MIVSRFVPSSPIRNNWRAPNRSREIPGGDLHEGVDEDRQRRQRAASVKLRPDPRGSAVGRARRHRSRAPACSGSARSARRRGRGALFHAVPCVAVATVKRLDVARQPPGSRSRRDRLCLEPEDRRLEPADVAVVEAERCVRPVLRDDVRHIHRVLGSSALMAELGLRVRPVAGLDGNARRKRRPAPARTA